MLSKLATRGRLLALAAVAAGALSGCAANTGLTNLWRDPEWSGPPMTNVLVVTLRRNPVNRRMWEDGFAYELSKRHVHATPSYRLFANDLPDTDAILDAVNRENFDGVLVCRPAGQGTEQHYVPGYVTTVPVTRRSPWTGWYHTRFADVYRPGYVETDRVVYNEIHVWDPRSEGGLLWAGTAQTLNPTSSASVNREISQAVVPELSRQGLIPRK